MVPKFRVYETDRKAMHYTDKDLVVCFSDNGVDVIDHTTFSSSCMDIDNFVLMQSTGLFDLDGNEIYIGDILKIEDEYTQVVFHEDNTTYGIYLEDKEGGGNPISDYSTRISLNHIKGTIKGNKFEHPHLLEGDTE